MALTVTKETTPNGGTIFPGEDGKLYERFRIVGDSSGGNADIVLGGGRVPKSARLIPGNVTPAAGSYAVSLQPSASVDVRVVVPASLTSTQYIFVEVEVSAL